VNGQSRVSRAVMTAVVAALSVVAIASWSEWSVAAVPSVPVPPVPSAPSPVPPSPSPSPSSPVSPASPAVSTVDGNGPHGSMTVTGTASVALTFDDGPDPVNTPKILNLLQRNEVKATFCVVGTQVRAHPGLVCRIVAEGHTLCNHSWQHRLDLGTRAP